MKTQAAKFKTPSSSLSFYLFFPSSLSLLPPPYRWAILLQNVRSRDTEFKKILQRRFVPSTNLRRQRRKWNKSEGMGWGHPTTTTSTTTTATLLHSKIKRTTLRVHLLFCFVPVPFAFGRARARARLCVCACVRACVCVCVCVCVYVALSKKNTQQKANRAKSAANRVGISPDG